MPKTLHEQYISLLYGLRHGEVELNQRTKTQIYRQVGAQFISLALNEGVLPVAGNRRMYPHVAAAECAWQLMGTTDPSFIMRWAPKLWSKFVQEGEVPNAYGFRMRKHFYRDQVSEALQALRANPSDRQVNVNLWDPKHDGLGNKNGKNVPCVTNFTLDRSWNGERLNMAVFMRSSDVIVGLPYDVMTYALTLDALAASLECVPNVLTFTLAHAHYYEPQRDIWEAGTAFNERVAKEWRVYKPTLPGWTVEQILSEPDEYVNTVKRLAMRAGCSNHPYDPRPEVVE